MTRTIAFISIVWCFMLGAIASAEPAALPPIIAISDPAQPTAAELGRGGVLSAAKVGDGAIFAVTGGAVASVPGTAADRPTRAVALLDLGGVDVVNLAARDLRDDPAALAAAIGSAKAKFISASFKLASGAKTPWVDVAILNRGDKKIAVIGLASRPDDDTKNLVYTPPAEAFAHAMTEIGDATDVVVLADLPLSDVARLLKDQPKLDWVIVSARGGGPVAIAGQLRVCRAPVGGNTVAVIEPGKTPGTLALAAPTEPSAAFKALVTKMAIAPQPAPVEAPKPETAAALPSALSPDALTPIGAVGRNRAVDLTIKSAGLFKSYGDTAAPEGSQWLVIDAQFQNRLTPQIVRDQQVPVTYQVANLYDNLYVISDGRVLARHDGDALPGELPPGQFDLPRMGSSASGKIVLPVPVDFQPADLTLRFYDFTHGNIILPLLAGKTEEAKPLFPPQKNQVVEAAVFGVKPLAKLADKPAPVGMTYVQIDLRARSVLQLDADATSYDPSAKPGQKMKVGTVADWKDSRKYIQAVVDGEYGYAALDASPLPTEPRFLPDTMTGGTLTFLVPQHYQSLELRCDFPNAIVSSGGSAPAMRLAGLTLPVQGHRPALPARKAIATIQDNPFEVNIVGQSTPKQFGDSEASDDTHLLALDVTVKNIGKTGEFFQPKEQLKHVAESGETTDFADATEQGPHPCGDTLWIPPGEQRTFTVVYTVPANETRPRLAYAAVNPGNSKTVFLSALTTQGAAEKTEVAQEKAPPLAASQSPAITPAPATPVETAQPPAAPAKPQATRETESAKAATPPLAVSQSSPATPAIATPAPAPVAANHPPRVPKGLAGVGLTAAQVNKAIDDGSAFLWNYLKTQDLKNSRELGTDQSHVLCALALVHAGAQKKYPDFDAALRQYLGSVDPKQIGTYQSALLCMLIDAYGDPAYLPKLRTAGRYLLESQGPSGTFTYNVTMDPKVFVDPASGGPLQVSGRTPPPETGLAPPPWKRRTDWKLGKDGDNSNSQFAMLGLEALSRNGVKLPAETWQRALDELHQRHNKDGGWGYNSGGSYGSMTCAGIGITAIALHELGGDAGAHPATNPDIATALDWLNANFSIDQNPKENSWELYYLYSLERTGRLLDTEFIGDHEWYPQGARYLVDKQGLDGGWIGKGDEADRRLASSFALMFLTRATETLAVHSKPGEMGTLKTGAVGPAGLRLYVILDASGSMLDEMGGKQKFQIARDAVNAVITTLPPNSQLALRVYGNKKSAIDPGADEDTELLVPMGPVNAKDLAAKLAPLRARGKTPLALSLQLARQDIPHDGKPTAVLLLTDGGEDTRPRKNPVKDAATLVADPNVTLDIVGFDIGDRADWTEQLQAMAAAAGGHYWPAAHGEDLIQSLRTAIFKTPETYVVLDQSGKQLAENTFGASASLPQGQYTLRTSYSGQDFDTPFWISGGETTSIVFDANQITGSAAGAAPNSPAPAASVARRFCTHCGAPLPPGAKFCPKCGAKVE